MKARLIVNPVSGTHDKVALTRHVSALLRAGGWDVEVTPTKCAGDATLLAAQAIELGFDAVIAAGGDGTVNETARAMCGTDVPMGIIPCGSGNGLARHLAIPMSVEGAAKLILNCTPSTVDAAEANGQKFFCTCGMGFDAQVSYDFAQRPGRGLMSYLQSTYQTFRTYGASKYRIIADEKETEVEALLIAVCNASQYGNNAFIAPEASVTDGLLDVAIVHPGDTLSTLRVAFDIMAGMTEWNPQVDYIRASHLVIERPEEAPTHIDGEPTVLPASVEFKCLPGTLKVFTHHPDTQIRPILTATKGILDGIKTEITNIVHKD